MKKKFNSIYRWIAMLAVTAVVVTAMPVDNGLKAIASEVSQDGEADSGNNTPTENDNNDTSGNDENTGSNDNKEKSPENEDTDSNVNEGSSGTGTSEGSGTGTSEGSGTGTSEGSGTGTSEGSATGTSEGNPATEPEQEEEEPELVEVSPTLSCSDSGKVEMGSNLVLTVSNQKAKGSYTITAGESNPGSAVDLKIKDSKCTLPTGTVGEYTFKVTYTSEDGTKSKNADVKYTVQKGLTIKVKRNDKNEELVIEKKSDGTTDLPEGIDVTNYFSVEGKPDGVELTLSIESDGWKYKSALPESAEKTNVEIENISEENFKFDKKFYYINNDSNLKIGGKITPAEINQKEPLDLTTGTKQNNEGKPYFELKLTEDKTVQIPFPKDSVKDGWINSNYGTDYKLPEDNGIFYTKAGFTKDCKVLLKEGSESDIVTCEDLYFVENSSGIVYGPLTLKYKCDFKAPKLGYVSLNKDDTAKGNQKEITDYELKTTVTNDGALVARNSDITVIAKAGDEEGDHSATAHLYATDEKPVNINISEIKTEKFSKENTITIKRDDTSYTYVYVRLIDQAGNSKDMVIDRTLLTDKKSPEITIEPTEIKDDQGNVIGLASVTATVEDDASGIYDFVLSVYDGKDGKTEVTKVKIDPEDYNGNNEKTAKLTITDLQGEFLTAKVEVVDYAGNSNSFETKDYFKGRGQYSVEFSFDPSENLISFSGITYACLSMASYSRFHVVSFPFTLNVKVSSG